MQGDIYRFVDKAAGRTTVIPFANIDFVMYEAPKEIFSIYMKTKSAHIIHNFPQEAFDKFVAHYAGPVVG
jgi:hypothetical protein